MSRFKDLGKCTIRLSLMVPRYPTFGMTCETKTWNTCGYNSFHFVVLYSISYSKDKPKSLHLASHYDISILGKS